MATTATERKLFVAGEWVETGEWIDVRSPYSGDVVGRVAKGGADETRRALDAAARALENPLPAHKRAEILVKVAGALGRRHEEVARTISEEAGKPMKAARVEAARAMSTYTFAAVMARTLAGEMVPMDGSQAGEGKLALHAPRADRRRRRDLAVQLPAQPRRAQDRARARGRLPGRAEAGDADAALGAPARRARGRGRASAGLAERRRRPGLRDRRRARRGRARAADHVHRLGRRRLGNPRARPSQEGQPRARQRDAGDRVLRRTSVDGREARRELVLLRRAELHLRPAHLRDGRRLGRLRARLRAEGRGAEGRRPGRRRHRRRPADRGAGTRSRARVDPRELRRGAHRRRADAPTGCCGRR